MLALLILLKVEGSRMEICNYGNVAGGPGLRAI